MMRYKILLEMVKLRSMSIPAAFVSVDVVLIFMQYTGGEIPRLFTVKIMKRVVAVMSSGKATLQYVSKIKSNVLVMVKATAKTV